jgi:hypothetical protein
MSRGFRITLLVVLILTAAFYGWQLKVNYDRMTESRAGPADTDLTNVRLPDPQRRLAARAPGAYRLGPWGAGLVLSLLGAGLLIAHEISQFVGTRALKSLYNDEGEGLVTPEYDLAEEEWNRGNHLEAVRMMREYLAKNPREQYVALRIAEIYEKDLHNPLAAALEYEEVLTKKLPPERWGWAAIHLCNLYTGHLNQPEKAVALLRRIHEEYGDTQAAEKARARLEQLAAEGVIAPVDQPTPPAEPEDRKLPPGFMPKKG